jgi:hypothetical protein
MDTTEHTGHRTKRESKLVRDQNKERGEKQERKIRKREAGLMKCLKAILTKLEEDKTSRVIEQGHNDGRMEGDDRARLNKDGITEGDNRARLNRDGGGRVKF